VKTFLVVRIMTLKYPLCATAQKVLNIIFPRAIFFARGGIRTCVGESGGAYTILVWKPEGRIPLGRLRRRWDDNIKMDLREVGWGGRALMNAVMHILDP
jgi:hypothetical protein